MDNPGLKLELFEKLSAENDSEELAEVNHIRDGTDGFDLSEEQLNAVNERYEDYERGEAKTCTWEEVKRMLEQK